MKFSIIIPTYESAAFLAESLDSIFVQTCYDHEVIIVDGGSTDGTLEIIKKYEKKFGGKLKWISEKDNGIFDAMNKGVKIAAGNWVYFMGSDDALFDEKVLENVAKKDLENLDVVNGDVKLKNANVVFNVPLSLIQILERGIHHQSIFCRREMFEKFGNFNLKYRTVADWEFNMRWFSDKTIRRLHVDQVITLYNENGFSSENEDKVFVFDKEKLVKKYFSPFVNHLYKNKFFVCCDIIQKAFGLLKKEGAKPFFFGIYKFLIHGRTYFKDRK